MIALYVVVTQVFCIFVIFYFTYCVQRNRPTVSWMLSILKSVQNS